MSSSNQNVQEFLEEIVGVCKKYQLTFASTEWLHIEPYCYANINEMLTCGGSEVERKIQERNNNIQTIMDWLHNLSDNLRKRAAAEETLLELIMVIAKAAKIDLRQEVDKYRAIRKACNIMGKDNEIVKQFDEIRTVFTKTHVGKGE